MHYCNIHKRHNDAWCPACEAEYEFSPYRPELTESFRQGARGEKHTVNVQDIECQAAYARGQRYAPKVSAEKDWRARYQETEKVNKRLRKELANAKAARPVDMASDALYLLCLLYDAVEDEKLDRKMSKRLISVDGAMNKVKALFERTGAREHTEAEQECLDYLFPGCKDEAGIP